MRTRLLDAALDLFAVYGVNGTSLQMIADRVGVAKAAVYYHYRTKAEIVRACLEPAARGFEALAEEGAQIDDRKRRHERMIVGLADEAIANRRVYSILFRDLAVLQLIDEDEGLARSFASLRKCLGPFPDPDTPKSKILVDIFLSGLVAPMRHSEAVHMSDAVIREAIVDSGRALIMGEAIAPRSGGSRSFPPCS